MRVIAGRAKSLALLTLPGNETRPTTDRIKETLFNMIAQYLPDCTFLDLFSGSGAIGIEAASRGAKSVVFVEQNRKACDIIKKNLKFTRTDDVSCLLNDDVHHAISTLSEKFDIVFMDPPYNTDQEIRVLKELVRYDLVDEDSLIIIEASLETDIGDPSEYGYEFVRIKKYKTNMHMFLRRS